MFVIELLLPIHRIGADPRDLGVELRELRFKIAENTAFLGSTGGHCSLVKEQNQWPVLKQFVQFH